jgi:hypothetical protein
VEHQVEFAFQGQRFFVVDHVFPEVVVRGVVEYDSVGEVIGFVEGQVVFEQVGGALVLQYFNDVDFVLVSAAAFFFPFFFFYHAKSIDHLPGLHDLFPIEGRVSFGHFAVPEGESCHPDAGEASLVDLLQSDFSGVEDDDVVEQHGVVGVVEPGLHGHSGLFLRFFEFLASQAVFVGGTELVALFGDQTHQLTVLDQSSWDGLPSLAQVHD